MSKILSYNKFYEEVELTLKELGKTKDGEFRGNVLVQRLKNHQPITTNNNKEVTIDKMKDEGSWVEPEDAIDNITDPDGNYDIDKAQSYFKNGSRFIKVFQDDENEYQLNQFKKTKEFGSKGAGRLVREFESIQCIFLGIKQAFPNQLITSSNIFRFFRRYKSILGSDESLVKLNSTVNIDEELLDDFLQDENWLSTFYRIPNKLWSARYNYLDRDDLYLIYHVGNKDVDSIYVVLSEQFKKLSITGGFRDINITKWCPADVYMVSINTKDEIINAVKLTKNINELNSVIDKYFDDKKLLPLSLKKIDKNAEFKIIINREADKDLPEFEIATLMTNSNPLKGIGSKISTFSTWKYRNNKDVDHKSRVLNLDSSDSSKKQDIDGEVEGSSSRHGKISFNAMKRIIDSARDILSLAKLNPSFQTIQSTSDLSNLDLSDLEKIALKLKVKIDKVSPDTFILNTVSPRSSDISGNKNKLVSKIQSLQIVLAISQIHSQDNTIANNIITKIMRYALSIQTDKFDTPRYLRVI